MGNMSLSKAVVAAAFKSARAALSGSQVTIRHDAREYVCTRGTLELAEFVGDAGSTIGAQGMCRAVVVDFGAVRPQTGDVIEVYNDETKAWDQRVILVTRYDETKATMLISYGELYDGE